jgi:hypothetical protein
VTHDHAQPHVRRHLDHGNGQYVLTARAGQYVRNVCKTWAVLTSAP